MMKKKIFNNIFLVLSVVIVALLVEIIFNSRYLLMNEKYRGENIIDFDRIEVNDMIYEDGNLLVTGDNPFFSINENFEVCDLEIKPSLDSRDFRMIIYNETPYGHTESVNENINSEFFNKKAFWIDPNIKEKTNINVNKNSNDFFIKIDTNNARNENPSIKISEIKVSNKFEFNYYRFFMVVSILFSIWIFVLYNNGKLKQLHIVFLLLSLIFGFNIVFLTPSFLSFDEKEHFVKAYQTASFDFGQETEMKIRWPENIDQFFYSNGRDSPFDSLEDKDQYFQKYQNSDFQNKLNIPSTAETYLPTAYIFSALGIGIAKIMDVPFILLFYFGRIFGMIFYSLIISIVIKHIKICKRLVFLLGLLPGQMYLACSYSADPVTYIFAIATVSVFVNMITSEDNSISWRMIFLFIFCCIITITGKMTYSPLCLLIFAVPFSKFKIGKVNKKKVFTLKTLVVFIAALTVLLNLLYSNSMGIAQWVIEGVNPKDQVLFILNNVFEYIYICFEYISKSAYSYFSTPIGSFAYAGSLSKLAILGMIVYIFVLSIIDNEEGVCYIDKKVKINLFFTIILSWGLTITALYITYNVVGTTAIQGVQGRYYAPLLLPTFLLLKNKSINCKLSEKTLNKSVVMVSMILLSYTVIYLFSRYSA